MIDLNGYTAPEFACKCGKTHSARTERIITCDDAIQQLPEVCKEILAEGRVGIVGDENVKTVAYDVERVLVRAGYRTRAFILPAGFTSTREQAEKLADSGEDVRLWVAVGCGSIADTVRYCAFCRSDEWVMFPTAPTTDAVLFPYCDYTENGVRITIKADPPRALVADYSVIENAPGYTVAAGYGTLLSKLTRAFDFAFDGITDKKYCKTLTREFTETVTEFFGAESCESISLRICRTLIRLGVIAQLADEEDFTTGGGYFAARCLKTQFKDERLIGENAAISSFTAYCILEGYLKHNPFDLYIPSSLPEYFRYLNKNCGLSCISLLKEGGKSGKDEAHLYVLQEYAEDLLNALRTLYGNVKSKTKQFRRLYEDAGYWLGSYCSCDEAFKTVAAAYAAGGDGLLSSLALGGALESVV